MLKFIAEDRDGLSDIMNECAFSLERSLWFIRFAANKLKWQVIPDLIVIRRHGYSEFNIRNLNFLVNAWCSLDYAETKVLRALKNWIEMVNM